MARRITVHIVYLSDSRLPSRAANSVHVMRMCQAFTRAGHDVTLVAFPGGDAEDQGSSDRAVFDRYGITVPFAIAWVPKRARALRWVEWLQAARIARRARPDLVYARDPKPAALAFGRDVVFEAHTLPSRLPLESRFLFRLLKRRRLVRIVAISDALRRDLIAETGVAGAHVMVAHDGADLDEPSSPATLPGEPVRVGYIGSLYPGRGTDIVLAVARAHADLVIEVVGGEPADVAALRRDAPHNATVHGHLSYPEARAVRNRCDVLLAPYQARVTVAGGGADTARWMSPLKIFEYMAAGRAIVASDLPVLREVLDDGETALLVPPDDVDAWIEAVGRLAADGELRARLGTAARARVAEHHTWRRRADDVLAGLAPQPPDASSSSHASTTRSGS